MKTTIKCVLKVDVDDEREMNTVIATLAQLRSRNILKAVKGQIDPETGKRLVFGPTDAPLPSEQPTLPRLAVVLEGGMVQAVVSDRPEAFDLDDLMIIDYDTDGVEADAITHVPQGDGGLADALVYHGGITKADIDLHTIERDIA